MDTIKLLGEGKFYEMQIREEGHVQNLIKKAVPFVGALRYHYNPNMVLLLTRPLEHDGVIYEFRQADIIHAEQMPTQTLPDGSSLGMAKIWLAKGAIAMRMQPIRVGEDTPETEEDFEN